MTPLDLARNLARDPKTAPMGVAIVARGLADGDPETFKLGWPMESALPAAATYLGLDAGDVFLIAEAGRLAPTLSDAILNRQPKEVNHA